LAGEISDIYIGATTDDAPIPSPPIKRNIINKGRLLASALPMADMVKRNATINKTGFLPNLSAGFPDDRAPIIVPIRADEIVKPCQKESRSNNSCFLF